MISFVLEPPLRLGTAGRTAAAAAGRGAAAAGSVYATILSKSEGYASVISGECIYVSKFLIVFTSAQSIS